MLFYMMLGSVPSILSNDCDAIFWVSNAAQRANIAQFGLKIMLHTKTRSTKSLWHALDDSYNLENVFRELGYFSINVNRRIFPFRRKLTVYWRAVYFLVLLEFTPTSRQIWADNARWCVNRMMTTSVSHNDIIILVRHTHVFYMPSQTSSCFIMLAV